MSAKLYTPELLGLATELADWPLDPALPLTAQVRSQTCGSTLRAGFELGNDGAVTRTGLQVSACAMGQAAAAIFARHVAGRKAEEIAANAARLESWLNGAGPPPDWPDIAKLAAAAEYPARHGAMLLPWRAAREALCNRP